VILSYPRSRPSSGRPVRIRAFTSGYLLSEIGPEYLDKKISKGQVLENSSTPTPSKNFEEVRSPIDGVLFLRNC
jgi:hypothetical protein